MLQASLKDNVVFSDEAIVDAIFAPSEVDDATVDGKLAEQKKYEPMVMLLVHNSEYKYTATPLQGDDHAHHINCTWLDTHSQAISVDPGIHLTGHRPRKKYQNEGNDVEGDNDDQSNAEDHTEDPNVHRKRSWTAESKLYDLLQKIPRPSNTPPLRYIANFVEGGDVMIGEGVEMLVSNHRNFVIGAPNSHRDPTAHRIILGTRGRSLSTYTSTMELFTGAKCAAEGLEALNRCGILHRDVSLGNVLLGLNPSQPFGFITDFDHATVTPEAIKIANPENGDTILSQMKRAEWRTGTPVFKAVRVLSQLTSPRSRNPTFEHKLCHDFESLIWIVVYAMMVKRACLLSEADKSEYEQYKTTVLDRYWGAHSFQQIQDSHRLMVSLGADKMENQIEDFWFSNKHEAAFFRKSMLVVDSQIRGNQPVTYEAIQQLFDDELKNLSSA